MLAAPAPGVGLGCYPLPTRGHLCPCALAELGAGRARPATQPSCWRRDVPAKTDRLGKPRQCLALLPAFPTFTLLPSPLPAPPAFTLLPTLPAITSISPPHMTPHSPCSHPCNHLCSPCTHPCSPHCPIPASPVFSLLVLTPGSPASELQEHLSDSPPATLATPSAAPTLCSPLPQPAPHALLLPCHCTQPCRAAMQNIILRSPRTSYSSRTPQALQTVGGTWGTVW